jgi:hypothetical protein
MKTIAKFGISGLIGAILAIGQTAQPASPSGELLIHGSIRTRVEGWDWFEGAGNSAYAFSGSQARLSVGQSGKRVDWLIEMEAPLLLGMPTDAIASGAQGALGLGGNYTAANDRSSYAGMVFAKQAYLRWKAGAQALRVGRFEFSDGAEMMPADATLAWVKRERVAQRLIGPFGWSHVGRSFDGLQYTWNSRNSNLTVAGVRPTRGAFQVDGWGELDVALGYAAFTREKKTARSSADWRVFGSYYQDWRNVVKTDNRLASVRSGDRQNLRIGSFGGHYAQSIQSGGGAFDVLVWGVLQMGRWGRIDHRAHAVAFEGGWQPPVAPKLKPWLRAGYYRGSGDADPNDSTHGTFFQMLPTPRPYARTPFFNLMNNQDIMGTLILRPHKSVTVRGEVHRLRLAERSDLWYTGGGAFQPWTFGYVGRASSGNSGLATMYDASVDYTMNSHWSATAYFGHARGGDVVQSIYLRGSNANFGYLELNYKF